LKIFGIAAAAVIAALVLGFGARLSAPTAHADTTGLVVVPCELIADAIDGSTTDAATSAAEYTKVCGASGGAPVLAQADLAALALAIGDKAMPLTKSDFATIAPLGGNQINSACKAAAMTNVLLSIGCTLDVFVFVNQQLPVTFTTTTGLAFVANTPACGVGGDPDCDPAGVVANTDGVVVTGLINVNRVAGDVGTITATQNNVDQQADINVVGSAHNVALTLAKSTIQSSGSTAAFNTCASGSDVTDSTSLSNVNSTVAIAVVTDSDGVNLTRVPVTLKSATTDAADFASGANLTAAKTAGIVTTSGETVAAGTSGTAQFAVLCGGKNTGTSKITATINPTLVNEDVSSATVTVTGAPDAIALTASPAQIACDGTQTSSVTAKVTDSAGNNVADGTSVFFDVLALGTANPIKVKTSGGSASSTITPLSGSTAGVTVIVSAGAVGGNAQSSIRVDCSLPIPTAVPAGPTATPTGGTRGVIGPDTGNGGYLGQNGSAGIPTWTLVALALGSVALVAGGMVTRRAGK
jgi:adhesin/invasin